MTQPAKVQEPSMEEILASIRRIIADDEAKPADVPAMTGAGAGVAMAAVENSAPRLHNVAAVATHPASSHGAQSRGDAEPMLAGVEKNVTSAKQTAHDASHDDHADVFDLTDEMALPPPIAPSFRKVEPKDDVEFSEIPVFDRPEPARARPAIDNADILSKTTAATVESAFNSLASTVLSANSRTLEDLVKEMMRPMLKNWLDDNLPGLVERIVKTEIERVARGR